MVSKQETDMFGDLLSAFEDIEEGTHVPGPSAQALNETRDLLSSLTDMGFEYGNLTSPESMYDQDYGYESTYDDGESKLNNIYGRFIDEGQDPDLVHNQYSNVKMAPVNVAPNKPYVPGMNWVITEEQVLGMKSATMYSIKCSATNQVVLDNIMMYESALALRNILNAGKTLTDPKVLGIISSGIQYTKVVKEAIASAKKRQIVLKESRYDDAKELDVIIAEQKNKAKELQERVMNFLREEGFITD